MKAKNMAERAVSYFKEGYICAESVLMAYAEAQGIKSVLIPRIATGFGGGIGRKRFCL